MVGILHLQIHLFQFSNGNNSRRSRPNDGSNCWFFQMKCSSDLDVKCKSEFFKFSFGAVFFDNFKTFLVIRIFSSNAFLGNFLEVTFDTKGEHVGDIRYNTSFVIEMYEYLRGISLLKGTLSMWRNPVAGSTSVGKKFASPT